MLNSNTALRSLILTGFVTALAACGGGGGSSHASTPTPPATFPVAAAINHQIINGTQIPLKLSINDAGQLFNYTYTLTIAPAIAATFEGQAGLSGTQTESYPDTPNTWSQTIYYDSNYNELGRTNSDGEYSVVTASHPYPAAAHVHDTGDLDSVTTYSDQTKASVWQTSTSSYSVEPDTDTSIIFHITLKTYDADHALLQTTDTRFRVDTASNTSLVSTDVVSAIKNYTQHVTPQ